MRELDLGMMEPPVLHHLTLGPMTRVMLSTKLGRQVRMSSLLGKRTATGGRGSRQGSGYPTCPLL